MPQLRSSINRTLQSNPKGPVTSRIIFIHQPEFLPWLGFWDKMRQADTVVLLDHVAFEKNYFQNRNRIRTAQGECWLTVPVHHRSGMRISDVEIDNSHNWWRKIIRSIEQNYQRAPYYDKYWPDLRRILTLKWTHIASLNEELIYYLTLAFNLNRTFVRSSDLSTSGHKSELLLRICLELGATTYLSGVSGRDYLDERIFNDAGIEVRYQDFKHPTYTQQYEPFISQMSGIDLLFNHGPNSLNIVKAVNP